MSKFKKFLLSSTFQTIATSVLCALLGLLIGFICLLIIHPSGAFEGIYNILQGPLASVRADKRLYNLGTCIAKAAPLILAGLAILFSYKAGLFNIGAAGQYTIGAGVALFCALQLKLPWYACMLFAMIAGSLLAAIVGLLKAFLNVNEVISGIMLNWISLYAVNMLLDRPECKDFNYGSETWYIWKKNASALLPNMGLDKLFNNNQYVTIGVIIAIVVAIIIFIILKFTTFGYEIKATGHNKYAAKYAGMKEKINIVITLAISGAIAGLAASCYYQIDLVKWLFPSSVPSMGFDGISAAFLGGLDPFGVVVSSFFIQYITDGGGNLDLNYYNPQVASLITSIIIYLCAFVAFVKHYMTRKLTAKKEEKEEKKEIEVPSSADNSEGDNGK